VIWNLLEPKISKGRLHKVRLYETPGFVRRLLPERSSWRMKDGLKIELGRRYRFSASHRLPQLEAERGRKSPRLWEMQQPLWATP